MKKILLSLALIFSAWTVFAQDCGPFEFPSYNLEDSSAANAWGTDIFELSQAYPAEAPDDKYPWQGADFRRKPEQFMNTVLDYCWAGMPEANFVAQFNQERKWYHAPWLHHGFAGREFLRGLRMDRTSAPEDLAPEQNSDVRNYSITYYNPAAATTLNAVWCDPAKPDAAKASFPVGSVIFKMVFTLADTGDVPFLIDALEWDAFVQEATSIPLDEKEVRKVRLIQVDYMVKSDDPEAVNGWIMGSHVYDGRVEGEDVKDKLVPVGLQWGNDPTITPAQVREGTPLTQTWLNTKAWNQEDLANSAVQKTGWGFRLQGVVGNHGTSMMAEASTAGWPPISPFPPSGVSGDSLLNWHRNLPSGTPFDSTQTSLDYSLELRDAIRNWNIDTKNDSIMEVEYRDDLAEMLAFRPPLATPDVEEGEEEEEIHVDEGLTGRNLYVFIGFLLLVVVMLGLLVMNLIRKD